MERETFHKVKQNFIFIILSRTIFLLKNNCYTNNIYLLLKMKKEIKDKKREKERNF